MNKIKWPLCLVCLSDANLKNSTGKTLVWKAQPRYADLVGVSKG